LEKNTNKIMFVISFILITSFFSMGLAGVTSNYRKEQQDLNKETTTDVELIGAHTDDTSLVPDYWAVSEIEKHIDINNEAQVNKVLDIVESTPLDEVTASILVHYNEEMDVPLSLILSIIDIESKFSQYEVGAHQDRGYCQIVPSAEKWLTKTYGHRIGINYDPSRIFEPEYNLGLGVLYIHILSKAYDNDFHRVLSEYNRGPYNLEKYYKTHGTYQTDYSRMVLNNQQKYMDIQI